VVREHEHGAYLARFRLCAEHLKAASGDVRGAGPPVST
jgi:hypothetical protein